MALTTHVIRADWHEFREALQRIRQVVFIEEQEVPRDLEWDGEDETSHHFLALNEAGQYIGCARLMANSQIGRMAVLIEQRGNGIGAQLLDAALDHARELGFRETFLHAQTYAIGFYQKAGFVSFGDEFSEAGIAHQAMRLVFPLDFDPPEGIEDAEPNVRYQPVRETLTQPGPQTAAFDDLTTTREHLLKTISAAKRRVLIMSPLLDSVLFDDPELVEALSTLARSAQRVEIRILIFDSKLIVQRGHGIVELARHLEEKVKIRRVEQNFNPKTSQFVSADLDGYWLLPNHEVYEGVSDLADPVTTKRLNEVFATLWAKNQMDPELRLLRI